MVAVSPVVGGEVLKGPTAAFMAFAALELSADGVVDFYGELLDGIVADENVGRLPTLQTDTHMRDASSRATARRADAPIRRSAGRLVAIVVEQMRTAAILPVKRFSRAKQRLGESVADQLRVELARAMVADVLLALAQTPIDRPYDRRHRRGVGRRGRARAGSARPARTRPRKVSRRP